MQRLLTRYLPKTTNLTERGPSTPEVFAAKNALQVVEQAAQRQDRLQREHFDRIHREVQLNLSTQPRALLIDAVSPRLSFGPMFAGAGLELFALYQIFAGSYSYYCILGTIGLASLLRIRYVSSELRKPANFVRQVYALNDNEVELIIGRVGQQKSVVVPKKSFWLSGRNTTNSSNVLQCTADGVEYNIPANAYINHAKLAQL